MTPADVAGAVLELYAGNSVRFVFGDEPGQPGAAVWTVRGAAERVCPGLVDRLEFLDAFLIAWRKLTGWHFSEPESAMLSFSEVELALQDVACIERPLP